MPNRISLLGGLGLMLASLSVAMCGGETGTGGSTSGTSSSGGGSSTSTSTSTSSGMGGASSSSGTGSTSTSSSGAGGGCIENWSCGPWQTNGQDDNGSRTCNDLNNCGTTNNKPVTSATLPALDFNYFKCNVEPILDAKCSQLGCHGTETGHPLRVYSRGRLRKSDDTMILPANCNFPAPQGSTCIGATPCYCLGPHTPNEFRRNFDAARGLKLDPQGAPIANPDQTELIHQPIVGGATHASVHLFSANDADHVLLKNWLNGMTLASCDPSPN